MGSRPSGEVLIEMYYGRDMTLDEMGEEFGVSRYVVRGWMINGGIKRRSPTELTERSRVKMAKSQIGKRQPEEVKMKIGRSLKGIARPEKVRMKISATRLTDGAIRPSIEILNKMHNIQEMSTKEMGIELGVSASTISRWLSVGNVKKRGLSDISARTRDKLSRLRLPTGVVRPKMELLYEMYHVMGMYPPEMGREIGVCSATIRNWMDEHNIRRDRGRTMSPATRKKMSAAHSTPEAIERDRMTGIRLSEEMRKQRYNVDGRFYADSISEGAVALMLEKYLIPGGKIICGKNFQIRNNGIRNGGIDFLVNGEFLEWHPIRIDHDENDDDMKAMYKELSVVARSPEDRKTYNGWRREHEDELAVEYWMSRQSDVDDSGYVGANVELARDERELYSFMVRNGAEFDSYSAFRKEFGGAKEIVRGCKVEKGGGGE